MNLDVGPYEAGLDFFIKLDKVICFLRELLSENVVHCKNLEVVF